MHYSYGLSVINSHLSVGATILLTEQPVTSREFWDFFKTRDATSFAGVPFTYHVLRRLRFERMELPSLRMFTQAGGRLESEHVTYFATLAQRHGRRFFVMYGQTEATARISYLPPEFAEAYPASIGIAIPGGELRLRDSPRPRRGQLARGERRLVGGTQMRGALFGSGALFGDGFECVEIALGREQLLARTRRFRHERLDHAFVGDGGKLALEPAAPFGHQIGEPARTLACEEIHCERWGALYHRAHCTPQEDFHAPTTRAQH